MQGYMQSTPLLTTAILKHAVRSTPEQEIVTRIADGSLHRYTFADAGTRISQLAGALKKLGIEPGDRVGVVGWNTFRQLELYYAVAGIGAVCHTINPRLGIETASFVINDAEDKLVFFDEMFRPLVQVLAPHVKGVETFVAMTDGGGEDGVADDRPVRDYEAMIAPESETFDWPYLDENTPCGLCYTSGTTGYPKGVIYTHRSQVLHAMTMGLPGSIGVPANAPVLPVVPMFHVNAWGIPYTALLTGTKLVMPGHGLDGANLHDIIEREDVGYAVGVPTVWLNLLQHVEKNGLSFEKLKYTMVGGAALNERIVEGFEKLGVKVRHGWGMTEMSPVGTTNVIDDADDRSDEERRSILLRQGKPVPFVDLRIVSDDGTLQPEDGKSDGHLQVRGPWILSRYFGEEKSALTEDGWFDTGDVSVIHPDGRMEITDRVKDVIKSGGEWISTIEIENAAMSHPAVANAAAIGMPHPKWQERPLLVIELKAGQQPIKSDILEFVRKKLAKISWPDDVQVVDFIPLGPTGKILKTELRKRFDDYQLPTAAPA